MDQALAFVEKHGHAVVFVIVFLDQIGLPIPTIPILLAFGALAGSGRLDPLLCLGLATVACLCADFAWEEIRSIGQSRALQEEVALSRPSPHLVFVTTGIIHEFLRRDHDRLAAFLDAACRGATIAVEPFHSFRAGLLRHIGMEEKILLPAVKQLRGGEPLPLARQMKLDHSALAALLVPTPTPAIVERLRALLEAHNEMEEGEDGVYALCEGIVGDRRDALLGALRDAPPVKLAPYQDGPRAFASIERLLRATGRE